MSVWSQNALQHHHKQCVFNSYINVSFDARCNLLLTKALIVGSKSFPCYRKPVLFIERIRKLLTPKILLGKSLKNMRGGGEGGGVEKPTLERTDLAIA
mgnify:CR=1 FL=1